LRTAPLQQSPQPQPAGVCEWAHSLHGRTQLAHCPEREIHQIPQAVPKHPRGKGPDFGFGKRLPEVVRRTAPKIVNRQAQAIVAKYCQSADPSASGRERPRPASLLLSKKPSGFKPH